MSHRQKVPGWATVLALALACAGLAPAANAQTRPWPDTTDGIFVFNDQLDTYAMTEAQFQFAASNYVGCQKIPRDAVRHLRSYNSQFLVLHYRLGQALGYRVADASCNPTGDYLSILVGNDWVQEWPGDSVVQPGWFFQYSGSPRVFYCPDSHYLMELGDSGWREWWSGQVISQMQETEDDGLFADSYSIPNYFGGNNFRPNLPDLDETFELEWANREHDFTDYMRERFAGQYKWIPNVGALVTSRDPSDYSNVDGAMVEMFAYWGADAYFDSSDWALQMNRTLDLTRAGKIVLCQSYPNPYHIPDRLFALGSYLLVKGTHTYINLDIGYECEWFPEYAVALGAPTDPLPTEISSFFYAPSNVYIRHFRHGMVVVNPEPTSTGLDLGGTYNFVIPVGGGIVPSDGTPPGSLSYEPHSSITLAAHGAAILLTQGGGCSLACTASGPTSGEAGQSLAFTGTATPSGCTGSPSFSWSFGDGSAATGASVTHAYAAAGTYGWTLTATVDGETCTQSGSVTITSHTSPPVIGSLTKLGSPFRIKVAGSNLQPGIRVYIGGTEWTQVTYKNGGKILLAGGSSLKAAVPKGQARTFRFVNPDGGEASVTWQW